MLSDCFGARFPIDATALPRTHPKLRLTSKRRIRSARSQCALTRKAERSHPRLRAPIQNCALHSKLFGYTRNCALTSETTLTFQITQSPPSYPKAAHFACETTRAMRADIRNCTLTFKTARSHPNLGAQMPNCTFTRNLHSRSKLRAYIRNFALRSQNCTHIRTCVHTSESLQTFDTSRSHPKLRAQIAKATLT